jgi:hypothetical protein
MVLLAVDYPPLRVQERLGPLSVAVSQVEDEVMFLHRRRALRIVLVMILDAPCQGQDRTQTVPGDEGGPFAARLWHKRWTGRLH